MIATTSKANVYYLPASQPADAARTVSRWTLVQRRILRAWWRVRLALADLRPGRLRDRRGHRDDYALFLQSVIGEGSAQLIERRRQKPARPAKVLDFHAARLRLRPQAT